MVFAFVFFFIPSIKMTHDTTPVVQSYPNTLYGESPVKTIVIWIIGVVFMAQFVSWYIAIGLETALYSGVEVLAAASSAGLPPIDPMIVAHTAIDSISSKIDLIRIAVSIPVLIIIGFVGSHYLFYTILSCLVGIMIAGSLIIGSISPVMGIANFADPWKIVVGHALIESVFAPILMISCVLFLIGLFHTAEVMNKKVSKWLTVTPGIIIILAMGAHNIHNTRMGMAHGWTSTWQSLRIGMVVAMVLLGPLIGAGIVIRIKLLKTVPKVEPSTLPPLPQEKWKTLRVVGILVGVVVTFQEFVLRYYNAAMVQVVGTGIAPLLAGLCGIVGVGLHVFVSPKLTLQGFRSTFIDYMALASCSISALCFLLPVGAVNQFFPDRYEGIPVRGSGALVIGLLIIYTAFPVLMSRISHLALRHTRPGHEFMAKCLLLAFFAINRIMPCVSFHQSRHAAWAHVVTSIGLLVASAVFIFFDVKQEDRLAEIEIPQPPRVVVISRDIERQVSIETSISTVPTLVMVSPRVAAVRPKTPEWPTGIIPPQNSIRYPTMSTFDEL